MRKLRDRRFTIPATIAALAWAMALLAAPALAKEGVVAALDAPIARGTPGGTTLEVGITVAMLVDGRMDAIVGSSIEVVLTGPDGAVTRALATEGAPGHYTARVVVPASGVAAVDIGMPGSGEGDRLVLNGTPIVPGGITAHTAQVAQAIAVATAPTVRAPAVAPPVVAPATAPTAAPAPAAPLAPILLVVALGAMAVLAVLAAAAIRRGRSAGDLTVSGRAPEG